MIGRRGHLVRVLLWAIACAAGMAGMSGGRVLAQEGHGWFVVDAVTKEGGTKATVVHLPPPDSMSARGSVRVVQRMTRGPERLAWSEDTVYLLMPGERVAENEVARRVYAITAVPGIMAGWAYTPEDRPESLPTLAGKWGDRAMEVAGLAATPRGPLVLMRKGKGGGGALSLVVLVGSEWVEADLPWEVEKARVAAPAAGDRCRLITTASSFGVLIDRREERQGGRAQWCVATYEPPPMPLGTTDEVAADAPAAPEYDWTVREVTMEGGDAAGVVANDEIFSLEDQLVRVSTAGGTRTISVLGASEEFRVATLKDLGDDVRVAPVEGKPGFLAFLCGTAVEKDAGGAAAPQGDGGGAEVGGTRHVDVEYRLVEVTPSGKTLYDGPAKEGGPVSIREIEFLAVLLVTVMAAVVVFVLRPDSAKPEPAIALPKGLTPAENGRRMMATILDLGAGWLVISLALRLELSDLARPDVLFGTARGWIGVGGSVVVAAIIATVMEWQWGASIGKLLLGCRVMPIGAGSATRGKEEGSRGGPDAAGEPSRQLSLLSAVIRNAAKWMPWNVAEFFALGRHRIWSDRVSGTVVVTSAPGERGDDGAE